MSNYGYNYPEDPNQGSGNYSYPGQPGGGYPPQPGPYQGYPVGGAKGMKYPPSRTFLGSVMGCGSRCTPAWPAPIAASC
jgi:hypothetical protein